MQINSIIKSTLPYLIFAVIILSIKLMLIHHYGNATPFQDQWGAEANVIYLPFVEGKLTWAALFHQHVYHRIFTSNIFALAIFYFNNNLWNPILQMQLNSIVHVITLLVFLYYIIKHLSTVHQKIFVFIFCTILFSIPFGWVNTLQGFQVVYYFYLLFSLIFLYAMTVYKTYNTNWWIGIIAGALSFFSLALGIITTIVGALALTFRRYFMQEKNEVSISAIAILILITVIAINLVGSRPSESTYHAHSITQFLFALMHILAWPSPFLIGALIVQIPVFILSWHVLKNKKYQITLPLFLITITIWLFGIFTITAYGRAVRAITSRYTDIFAVGLVINFVALLLLMDTNEVKKKLFYTALGSIWISVIGFSFLSSVTDLSQGLKHKLTTSLAQEKNVRAYICSGDFSHLQNKPLHYIPYPDISYLKSWLDNPTIRNFLPGNIYPPNLNNPDDPDGKLICAKYLPKVINAPLESQTNFNITPAPSCIGAIDNINGVAKPKQFTITSILGLLRVGGWMAESKNQTNPPKAVTLVLTDANNQHHLFTTQSVNRPHLATKFKNPALNTGFISTINVSHLPAGNYTLGLGFVEGDSIKFCPQFKISGIINK